MGRLLFWAFEAHAQLVRPGSFTLPSLLRPVAFRSQAVDLCHQPPAFLAPCRPFVVLLLAERRNRRLQWSGVRRDVSRHVRPDVRRYVCPDVRRIVRARRLRLLSPRQGDKHPDEPLIVRLTPPAVPSHQPLRARPADAPRGSYLRVCEPSSLVGVRVTVHLPLSPC
jgi:hypothetical protein